MVRNIIPISHLHRLATEGWATTPSVGTPLAGGVFAGGNAPGGSTWLRDISTKIHRSPSNCYVSCSIRLSKMSYHIRLGLQLRKPGVDRVALAALLFQCGKEN